MKKFFLFTFNILLFFIALNVKASNLTLNYYGNPYYVISGNGESHSNIVAFYEFNGEVAYCVEEGVDITDYSYYEANINDLPYNEEKINLIKLIGYYGYEYPNHLTNNYRIATQALIWETLTEKNVTIYTEKYGNGNIYDISYEKKEIMNLVNNHYILPDFNNNQLLSVKKDNIIIDNNNVLNNFEIINSNDNLEVFKDGNKLHIKSNVDGNYQIKLRKTKYDHKTSLLYVPNNGLSQKFAKLRPDFDIEMKLNIVISSGKVNLEKLDDETKSNNGLGSTSLEGAKYGIYKDDNLVCELITNSLGEASCLNLPFGNYILKEIIPSYGYLLDPNEYEFTIDKNNLEINLDVYEKLIKKNVTIIKTLEGNSSILDFEKNINFIIYFDNTNVIYKEVTTNQSGVINLELPFGIYRFHQVNTTDGYYKSDDFIIEINENTTDLYKVIYDKKIKGNIKIIKKDKDTNYYLKDALIDIYKEDELVYSGYTNNLGILEVNDLDSGEYTIIERIAPKGYILDTKKYYVQINENSIQNELVIFNKHEEIIVPNTSKNNNITIKYISIIILIIGLIIIYYGKKKNRI